MKLIDIMHQSCAQMGKLYYGNGTITSTNPLKIQDSLIRINTGDYLGGTLILADQSYTIVDTNIDGTFTLSMPIGDPVTPDPSIAIHTKHNYYLTSMDRSSLVSAINSALISMGEHSTFVDLDVTATNQREFILEDGIVPMKISFFYYLNDTYNISFAETKAWDLSIKDGEAVLTFQNRVLPNEAAKIRVWYNGPHPMVLKDEDIILPDYHPRRLVYETAFQAYFQFLAKEQNSSDRDLLMYQSIMQERMTLTNKHPVPRLLHKITLPRN